MVSKDTYLKSNVKNRGKQKTEKIEHSRLKNYRFRPHPNPSIIFLCAFTRKIIGKTIMVSPKNSVVSIVKNKSQISNSQWQTLNHCNK